MPPLCSLSGVAIIPIPPLPGFKEGNWNRDAPGSRDQCQSLGPSEFPVNFSAGGISNRECHNILSIPATLYSYWCCDSSQITLTSLAKASFTQFQFLPMALTFLSVPLPNMPLSARPSPSHDLSRTHPQHSGRSLLPRLHCPLCTHKSILFCAPKRFLRILITVSTNTVRAVYAPACFSAASCPIHLCVLSTYQDQAHGWYALNVLSVELNTVKKFPIHSPNQHSFESEHWTSVLRHCLDSRRDFRQPCLCWELPGKGILKSSLSSSPLWMWRPRKKNQNVLHMVNTLMVTITSMTNFLLPKDDREGRLPVFPSTIMVFTLCTNLFFFVSFPFLFLTPVNSM